ncbi:MAG: vitamin B12-dependent ribonucleotide reductase [candidate division Zixibacteria bacterium]|nr:vitamin B12-dependent ribonucleotide reductase [candidate division Zixibacteria bacterium]MDH3937709.1 vitamin B12-dependent ribonucleotide reductase [candidate division Zixibacteria bacterium]MDH4034714.1 vitamin B12-dependent ribonucleotide reductase [candidate division Zixibacteria bacterium]
MWSKKEIKLSENALTVLKRRYLGKDKQGRPVETPREMFIRVARHIAEADRNYSGDDTQVDSTAASFFEIMADLDFLPNSPTLMNAGRALGQLSACFVLPVGDSMEEIFETNKQAALIHQSGGGTGFSFSRLRPRGSIVASTHGVASGPVSFMKVYNAATEAVKQGGTRRGANMGVLRVDHPDIVEFITCKDDLAQITNFNISVGITDAFMKALADGGSYPLYNPHTDSTHSVDGREQTLDAADVFGLIVDRAWRTGEPGVIFLDRMNRANPTYPFESIEATNPCGEQPLPPYDSCNLGSINLSHFVKDSLPSNYSNGQPHEGIDWERLASVIRTAVHFLDNVIDQNRYPLESIRQQTLKNRRVGLGVMGWADMLVQLGLPYNSDEALNLAERTMAFLQTEARNHSSELAKQRGKFPNWEDSSFAQENLIMRNCTVSTIAPTGTLSIIAGCSSGIEPFFAIAYQRNVLDGTRLTEVNPLFRQAAQQGGFYSDELISQVSREGSLESIDGVPDEIKAVFLTAADISPEDHTRMQAVFQNHCDSSVSKTINLAQSADRDEVRHAFELAFNLSCKGVTIYRDGSRPEQVLSTTGPAEQVSQSTSKVEKRPEVLSGFTQKIRTGYGNLYVTVNTRNSQPFELFAHIGKSGYTTMADTEAICRLVSLALRAHVPVDRIIGQLRGIGGSSPVFSGGSKVSSIPDAIAQVLAAHFGSSTGQPVAPDEICPECSGAMVFDSGCFTCRACGYSNC